MSTDSKTLHQLANVAKEHNQVLTALLLLEKIPSLTTKDCGVALDLGRTLREIGRFTLAKRVLRWVLNFDCSYEDRMSLAHLGLGRIYVETRDYSKAAEHFRKSIKIDPSSTVPYVYLSGALARQGRILDSIDVLEDGVFRKGDVDEVHFNLGLKRRATGEYELAREHFRAALKISPDYEMAQCALDDIEKAKALGLWSNSADAKTSKPIHSYTSLVEIADEAALENEKLTCALSWEKLLELNPSSSKLKHNVGDQFYQLGRSAEAEKLLFASLNSDPCNQSEKWRTLDILGSLYFHSGRLGSSESCLRATIAATPPAVEPYIKLSKVLGCLEKNNEAITVLIDALSVAGEIGDVHYHIGLHKRTIGEYKAACSHFRMALENASGYRDSALHNLEDFRKAKELGLWSESESVIGAYSQIPR